MRDLIKYFKKSLVKIYIKTLPIYILSVVSLLLGILYFPKGKYWIVCIGLLLFIVLVLNKFSKYITVKTLYESNIVNSNMKFNVYNFNMVKSALTSIITIPIGEIIYLVTYTLLVPGLIIDILFRTYFMQSIISGNSMAVLLMKKNDYSIKVRLSDYSKGNIVTLIVNTIHRVITVILFYMFTFKSYQELFSIGLYNTFITLVASFIIITIIKVVLQPYINYKDAIWAMMCVDPALGGIEVNPYGIIENNSYKDTYNQDNSLYTNNENYTEMYNGESYDPHNYDMNQYNNYNNQDIIVGLDGNMYVYYPEYECYQNVSTGEYVYYDPSIFGNGG